MYSMFVIELQGASLSSSSKHKVHAVKNLLYLSHQYLTTVLLRERSTIRVEVGDARPSFIPSCPKLKVT